MPAEFDDQTLFRLSELLDGTLDPVEAAALERQMEQDPALRAQLDALRQVDILAREHARPVPQIDWGRFAWDAQRRREDYVRARQRRRVLRIFTSLAAAAMIVFGLTVGLWHSGQPKPSTETTEQAGRAGAVAVVTIAGRRPIGEAWPGAVAVIRVSRTPPDTLVSTDTEPVRGRLLVATASEAPADDSSAWEDDADMLF